ncbi:MAG: hypothetical protein ABL956_14150 [Hyphomonadaceae bacterium]
MLWKTAGGAALLATGLLAATPASAQVPAHNSKKFGEVYAEIEEVFGGPESFQKAFEDARAEYARMEGALQLSLNLEARLRANNSAKSADIYLNAGNALRPSVEHLRTVFAKFDALETALDEARARAAYDHVVADHAALFQRPMTEQFEYSKTHPLTAEPLKSFQIAAETLIAVATRKPA